MPPEFAAAWEQQLSGEGDSFEVTAETTSGFASCLKHLVLFAHLKISDRPDVGERKAISSSLKSPMDSVVGPADS